MKTSSDALIIGGVELHSRLFIGTGKYGSDSLIPAVAEASGAEVITVALRRVDLGNSKDNVLSHIPGTMRLLPNTSGARTADEAVRIARLSRAAGCGDWIKIEVISDTRHLLPDGYETAKATETLAKEGFTVLPYMNPDLYVARDLVNAGAAAVIRHRDDGGDIFRICLQAAQHGGQPVSAANDGHLGALCPGKAIGCRFHEAPFPVSCRGSCPGGSPSPDSPADG